MLTLITGGSKNGKSHIAEAIVTQTGKKNLFYIATMEPYGEEAHMAIERHRTIRAGKGFQTIECYTDIGKLDLPQDSAVLLECVGNLCANEMFSAKCENAYEKIIEGIRYLNEVSRELVLVSNQVGDDGIGYAPETMEYIRQMGLINEEIAKMADRVVESVYGIAVIRKGEPLTCIY